MDQESLKKQSAEAALTYVQDDAVIGVGTGSTVKYFIDALASVKGRIAGTVASSLATEKQLKALGIPVLDLNAAGRIGLYVDGADEANHYGYLIKGLGGALTREKIIASVSEKFICIIDQSKWVSILGQNAPVPIEVIPMARSLVGRKIVGLQGNPVYRENYLTDNGNIIIDAYNLDLSRPLELENALNCITGVVENGLFAHRPADIILKATPQGIETITTKSSR
jgi:ribose 5-phosphate isomerase A